MNTIEPQNTAAESYGMKATKFWPKKLVTTVMTRSTTSRRKALR